MILLTVLFVLFIIAASSINTEPKQVRAVKTTTVSQDRPYGSVKYLEDM